MPSINCNSIYRIFQPTEDSLLLYPWSNKVFLPQAGLGIFSAIDDLSRPTISDNDKISLLQVQCCNAFELEHALGIKFSSGVL